MNDERIKKGFDQKIEPGTLTKLFRRAAAAPFTGRIIFRRGSHSCSLFFKDGFILHARTNNPEHRLGEVLKAERGVDEKTIQMALKISTSKDQPLGMVLLEEKIIGPRDLYQCLVRQVELIVMDMIDWETGMCYIHPDVGPGEEVVLLKVSPLKIIEEKVIAAAGRKTGPGTVSEHPREAPSPKMPLAETPRLTGPDRKAGAEAPPEESAELPHAAAPEEKPARHAVVAEASPTVNDVVESEAIPRDEASINRFIREKEAVRDGDHYGILGLPRDSKPEKVKAAYQKLVRGWHPDRVAHRLLESDLERLHRIFARINEAYGTLSHKDKRVAFDREEREVIYTKATQARSPGEEAARLFQAGRKSIKEANYTMAIDCLNRACRLEPGKARYAYFLGAACFRARKLKQAEEALNRAIMLEGSNPDYYVALGQVYKSGKLVSRASEMFNQALRLAPNHEQALREKKSLEIKS